MPNERDKVGGRWRLDDRDEAEDAQLDDRHELDCSVISPARFMLASMPLLDGHPVAHNLVGMRTDAADPVRPRLPSSSSACAYSTWRTQ